MSTPVSSRPASPYSEASEVLNSAKASVFLNDSENTAEKTAISIPMLCSEDVPEPTPLEKRIIEKAEMVHQPISLKEKMEKALCEVAAMVSGALPIKFSAIDTTKKESGSINEIIERNLKKIYQGKKFKEFSSKAQCNLLLSLLITQKQMQINAPSDSIETEYNEMFKQLMEYDDVLLHSYIEVMYSCYMLQKQPESLTESDIQQLLQDSYENQFVYAIWVLVKQALEPGQTLVSPSVIIDLVILMQETRYINWALLSAFVLTQDEFLFLTDIDSVNFNLSSDVRWGLFTFFMDFLKLKEQEDRVSPDQPIEGLLGKLQQMCSSYVYLAAYRKQWKIQYGQGITGELFKYLAEPLNEHVFKIDVEIIEEGFKLLDPGYKKDILGLLLAWHYNSDLLIGGRAIRCAIHLQQCAKNGSFPLLYGDAATIYATFGFYKHAGDCIEELLKNASLSELAKTKYELMLEEYRENQKIEETQKEKRLEQKKQLEQKKTLDDQLPVSDQGATIKEASESVSPKRSQGRRGISKRKKAAASSRVGERKKEKESKVDFLLVDNKAEQIEESAQSTVEKKSENDSKVKEKPHQLKSEILEVRWVPDDSGIITKFNYEYEVARQYRTLKNQAECLEKWLDSTKGTAAYGRVCEEVCHFYRHQANLPTEPSCYLRHDKKKAAGKTGMLELAGKWLTYAEREYLGIKIPARVSVEQLKEAISQVLKDHLELRENQEYMKRVKGLCSSHGHIYSDLAGIYFTKGAKKYSALARDFYHLGNSLVPSRRKPLPAVAPRVELITQEEMARRRQT